MAAAKSRQKPRKATSSRYELKFGMVTKNHKLYLRKCKNMEYQNSRPSATLIPRTDYSAN